MTKSNQKNATKHKPYPPSNEDQCNNCQSNCGYPTKNNKPKIYVAGPLFNTGDRYGQQLIANTLEKAGYETYLPQRDGFEFKNLVTVLQKEGVPEDQLNQTVTQIIFNIDVYQLYLCSAIVANQENVFLDDGTVSETAISFCMGRGVVLFREDIIGLFSGSAVFNPLVLGLATVPVVTKLENIPDATAKAICLTQKTKMSVDELSAELQKTITDGKAQYELYKSSTSTLS